MVAAGALASRRFRNGILSAAAVMLLVTLGISFAKGWFAQRDPVAGLAADGAVATVEVRPSDGRLVDTGPGGSIWMASAVLQSVEARGTTWRSGVTVVLTASGGLRQPWADVAPGAVVRATVKLSPATDASFTAWASARSRPGPVAPPNPLDAGVNAVREGLREAVAGLPAAPRALVPALVVGDTSAITDEQGQQFRTTGLTHLLAVSGANLTLMLASLLWVASRLGVLGWWRRGVALVGVAAFVLLCRAEPSVLRAAAMGLVGLAALGWAGPRQGLRFLSSGIIALVLIDPWLSRSIGFVLSVLASAGIIVFGPVWTRQLSTWLPRWLAEAITVPVAAQLTTQPVVTAISGQVSVIGLFANLVAAPLVGPGTVLGFAAAWASVPLPLVAGVLGWAAGGFAQALCWIAAAGSALPGAALVWPVSAASIAVLVAACAVAAAGLPLLWRRRWLCAVAVIAMVVVCLRPLALPGWPPPGWLVVSCDVGQGDSTLIRAGPSAAIVVDTGPDRRHVDRCLDELGITAVPWLVLTHPHADHISGVAGVVDGREVDRLLLPATNVGAVGWRQVAADAPGVAQVPAGPGLVVSAGQATLTVLAMRPFTTTAAGSADSAEENDSSLVMRVDTGGLRIVLGGDVEEAGQSAAVAAGADLRADVLLVPHHGSGHQLPAFLQAVGERVALFSVGLDNDYGHPAARTVAAVTATGARVFRTDRNGSAALWLDGGQLVVTTQR
jgi:competence protein ComEC